MKRLCCLYTPDNRRVSAWEQWPRFLYESDRRRLNAERTDGYVWSELVM